ncbi:hypothetical protein [Oceanobacillus damuensis]|uniref:hypothetical protein n=1 Tax=Oceanobacillus damuensis TaxID=937928 RepID=UPI0008323727|nr:hypothetical protein [Oceanobacillus damuensis]
MIKQWGKNHTFIAVGILAATLLIYGIAYLYVIKPLQDEVEMKKTEVSMYENQLSDISNGPGAEVNEELAEAAGKIPNSKATDQLLIGLEEIARHHNVSIDSIAADGMMGSENAEAEEDSIINETSYIMDATAKDLNSMNDFLNGLSLSERLIRIDAINLQQSETDSYLTVTFTAFHADSF